MPTLKAHDVRRLGAGIFVALGVPADDAALVAAELVRTHQMGLESHGIVRFIQYVRDIRSGLVRPGSPTEILVDTPTSAVVDGAFDLGIVTAYRALEVALRKAEATGLALVVTRRSNHAGRLGAYPEAAARRGFICLAGAAIPQIGHFVVPWGGIEGRLGTNPFAYAVPKEGDPIVSDFATSVIPEGRIRTALSSGGLIPPDAALDALGHPTRDPASFYGPPMGTLLPFGAAVAYKGYALGLLVELLGGTLAGEAVSAEDRPVNSLWMLVADPQRFLDGPRFQELATRVVDYMHSTKPAEGHEAVLVPGEREFDRLRRGEELGTLEVDSETWRRVQEIAGELDMAPAPEVAG